MVDLGINMLEKHGDTINEIRNGFDNVTKRQDDMLGKQDEMLERHDETIEEISI